MDSNIQAQLDELKATLEAIRQGIETLEARLAHPKDCQCNDCQHPESCPCDECKAGRADFNAWVEDVKRRWHNPDCGPLCTEHGDARDTSIRS